MSEGPLWNVLNMHNQRLEPKGDPQSNSFTTWFSDEEVTGKIIVF